ncbi:MAG TPA: aldo/keto reductase [Bryobacteraceae bacterium]|nr:aldo/keto reductase [Bryobacteraceae bacterium]
MRTRKLGKTPLDVPVITLGGNVFGWTVSESESPRLLDAALDAGLNFIDTADLYSRWVPGHTGGESETIIGKWLHASGKRDRVIVATKVGMDMGDGKVGLSPAYIGRAVEGSLRRLQTDRIDLYQSHQDDAQTPLEETLRTYERLIQQGKVRYIGASNYKGGRLREAMETSRQHHLPSYQSLQPHYNLVERDPYETDLAPVVAEYGLGVLPYFSLASGFLTGKYRSAADLKDRARGGMVGKYLNERGLAVLAALDEVAGEHHSNPARVALAWLIAQPGITSAIASATRVEHLADLAGAADLTLDAESIEKLDRASAPVAV